MMRRILDDLAHRRIGQTRRATPYVSIAWPS
jgi:hypothetical protein